jgi:hypothetical protein
MEDADLAREAFWMTEFVFLLEDVSNPYPHKGCILPKKSTPVEMARISIFQRYRRHGVQATSAYVVVAQSVMGGRSLRSFMVIVPERAHDLMRHMDGSFYP